MRVNWTKYARIDLSSIEKHIALDSQSHAKAMSKKIVNKTKVLDKHPFFGSVVEEYDNDQVRELLVVP